MKKTLVNTIGLCFIALIILAFQAVEQKTVTIVLTETEAQQYNQNYLLSIDKINDSDMSKEDRLATKKLLTANYNLLASKIKVDSVSKIKK